MLIYDYKSGGIMGIFNRHTHVTPSITIHQSAQHFGRLSKLQAKNAQHFRRGAHNIYVKLTISQSQIYRRYIEYIVYIERDIDRE